MFKRIVTVVLLLFIGVSVVVLAVGESSTDENAAIADPNADMDGNTAAADNQPPAPAPDPSSESRVIVEVYMFHGQQRCRSCMWIDEQTLAALEESFATEMAEGRVAWVPANYEKENQEEAMRWEVSSSGAVARQVIDGQEGEIRNLVMDGWQCVYADDAEGYRAIVVEAVEALLNGDTDD